jgi:AraC-like DNA-binding protein
MTYEDFTAHLPSDRTQSFTSAEEIQEVVRRYGVSDYLVRQLGRGEFRSDWWMLETEEADLFSDRYNKAISLYLEPPVGAVGFMFGVSAGGQFLASGEEAGNDKLVFYPEGTDIVTEGLAGSEAITVPEQRFAEMVEALCPQLERGRVAVIGGNTAELHALRKGVVDLLAHPETDPRGEQAANLVAGTIAWMGHACADWNREIASIAGAKTRVAKLAQEYIEESYREVVRTEDLCRVAGVGVRTLQRCFRNHFGLTVMQYLKTVRLTAAHGELVASDPAQSSVAGIALRHGFSHLGRFSVEFRQRFGEEPREALARHAVRNGH